MSVCMSYKQWYSLTELGILKELILIKLINQINVNSVIKTVSTMALNLIQKFVIDVTGENIVVNILNNSVLEDKGVF